jgi:hypothetical protein
VKANHMKIGCLGLSLMMANLVVGCSSPDTCKGISPMRAIAMTKTAKRGMLGRSTATERDNFVSDVGSPLPRDGGGQAIGFKGMDGRILVALVDEDCYIGWTIAGRASAP